MGRWDSIRAAMRYLIPLLLLAGCAAVPSQQASNLNEDQRFQAHAARVLDEVWQEFPEFAVRMGNYKYADQLTVPDQARRERTVAFYDRQLAALAAFDRNALSPSNRVDLDILKNRFERNRWYIVTLKAWQWQPSSYNLAPDLDLVLDTEYAPLDVRLRQTLARLANVPAYYAAARASIADPTPEHIELALRQNRGALGVVGQDLDDLVAAVAGRSFELLAKCFMEACALRLGQAGIGDVTHEQVLETVGVRPVRPIG